MVNVNSVLIILIAMTRNVYLETQKIVSLQKLLHKMESVANVMNTKYQMIPKKVAMILIVNSIMLLKKRVLVENAHLTKEHMRKTVKNVLVLYVRIVL